jgi:hypothetical protein
MYNSVHGEFPECLFDLGSLTNVTTDKAVARMVLYIRQILEIPCVRELVKVDEVNVGMSVQKMANEIAADESGPTCYEYSLHCSVQLERRIGNIFVPDFVYG